jgi:hypothetical protein
MWFGPQLKVHVVGLEQRGHHHHLIEKTYSLHEIAEKLLIWL